MKQLTQIFTQFIKLFGQQISGMLNSAPNLSPNDVREFRAFLSQQIPGHRRKLTGEEMSKLKRAHFNQYIKKIKYYARKDLDKIKASNVMAFYGSNREQNYENKEEASTVLKRQKPVIPPEIKNVSHYYFGKAELSSMKEFIFLAEECHKIEQNLNKLVQRRRNSQFIRNVEQKIQKVDHESIFPSKSVNLHLTLKTARNIDDKLKYKHLNTELPSQRSRPRFSNSILKSLGSTNFTARKSNSLGSLRPSIISK